MPRPAARDRRPRRTRLEDVPQLQLETPRRLRRSAEPVVRAVEQIRAREESLEVAKVPQVEHVEVHDELRATREREVLANPEIEVLQGRQLELTVAARRIGKPRRGGQRIR